MITTHIKLNTTIINEAPFLYVRSYLERNGDALEGVFCIGNEHRLITLHPAVEGELTEFIAKLTALRNEFFSLNAAINVFLTEKHRLWRTPFKERGDAGCIVHYRRRLFLQPDDALTLDDDVVARGDYQFSRAVFTAQVSTNTNTVGSNYVVFSVSDCTKTLDVNFSHHIRRPTTILDQLVKYLDNYLAVIKEVAYTKA